MQLRPARARPEPGPSPAPVTVLDGRPLRLPDERRLRIPVRARVGPGRAARPARPGRPQRQGVIIHKSVTASHSARARRGSSHRGPEGGPGVPRSPFLPFSLSPSLFLFLCSHSALSHYTRSLGPARLARIFRIVDDSSSNLSFFPPPPLIVPFLPSFSPLLMPRGFSLQIQHGAFTLQHRRVWIYYFNYYVITINSRYKIGHRSRPIQGESDFNCC